MSLLRQSVAGFTCDIKFKHIKEIILLGQSNCVYALILVCIEVFGDEK